MRECPHCHIQVGGALTTCPLCQSPLAPAEGTQERYFPEIQAIRRRRTMVYKVVSFLVLAVTVAYAAVDFLLWEDAHRHGSVVLLVWGVAALLLLRMLLFRSVNGPELIFRLLCGCSLLAMFTEWFFGGRGISVDYVMPALCGAALLVNFAFAFVKTRFTANSLVYLLMNILIGAVPYPLLMLRADHRTEGWVICLIFSAITFLGLVIFKGRELLAEIQKRLHL